MLTPFSPTGSHGRRHQHQRSAAPLNIERHQAGILAHESIQAHPCRRLILHSPAIRPAAGVAAPSRARQMIRISRTVAAAAMLCTAQPGGFKHNHFRIQAAEDHRDGVAAFNAGNDSGRTGPRAKGCPFVSYWRVLTR